MSDDATRLTMLELEYGVIVPQLKVIEQTLRLLDQRVSGLGVQLGDVAAEVGNVRAGVAALAQRMTGVERATAALLRHFKIDPDQQG